MFSYKSYILVLTLLACSETITSSNTRVLSETQAKKYTHHLLDTLFMPDNYSGMYEKEYQQFESNLTEKMINDLGSYPHFYSLSKAYNSPEVYKLVIDESLKFIETNAHICASNELAKGYAVISHSDTIVTQAVKNLMKELNKKIIRSAILEQGIFTDYFGTALINKMQKLIEEEIHKKAQKLQAQAAKLAEKKCPFCLNNYNKEDNNGTMKKKLTLACGHSVCVECLKSLWQNSNNVCPICSIRINLSEYANELWPPSAPSYNYYY